MTRAMTTALAAVLLASGAPLSAQTETVDFGGKPTKVTAQIPPELVGTYRYEKKGEPLVVLNADGTGSFQPHKVAPIPIRYWLMADAAGKPVKEMGQGNPNYGYTIILRYGAGGGGNYPENGIDGMNWVMDVAGGCAIILGERFKCG